MTIKVANIIEEGRLGGPQKRITEVASELYQHDIHTEVILPQNQSEAFQDSLSSNNVSYKVFHLHRLTKEKKMLVRYVLLFFYEIGVLWAYFKKKRFDVIHVSGGAWQIKGVLAGKLSGSKVIWHLNDTQSPRFIGFIFKVLAPRCADAFITAGNRVRQFYLERHKILGKESYNINAPVDCYDFDPDKVVPDSRIAGSSADVKIGLVANINPVKGLEYFVDMARAVQDKVGDKQNVEFWIVGPVYSSQTKYHARLTKQIEDYGLTNIKLYGPCQDVPGVLKALDIYVCSSIAEASPTCVWEAMSMAKAIVSTDVGDVADYVRDSEVGYIVPIKDGKALAEKVIELVSDPDQRKRFGAKAREIVLAELDKSVVVDKHIEAYRGVCALAH